MGTQREMCALVLRDMDSRDRKYALSSPFESKPHTQWVMQLVGKALSLPIDSTDDIVVMKRGINVYECWLGTSPWDCWVHVSTLALAG